MNRFFAVLQKFGPNITDADLLERFCNEKDEAAFDELVQRYSAVVWGVCSRNLANTADAEDAFQATFLVLTMSLLWSSLCVKTKCCVKCSKVYPDYHGEQPGKIRVWLIPEVTTILASGYPSDSKK